MVAARTTLPDLNPLDANTLRAMIVAQHEQLLSHPVVWAAAGSPRAVFSVTPADLVRVTEAKVVALAAT